jgi:hypothetical protein
MRDLSLRALLLLAAVALAAAFLASLALVSSQSSTAAPTGQLQVYGTR